METEVMTATHPIATREEWLEARLDLLKAEKELTRRNDDLARQRQELPWVRVEKDYIFGTCEGEKRLADLFHGRSQLLVYHLMFGPDYTAPCPSCSMIADGFNGFWEHLAHHDVMLVAASRARHGDKGTGQNERAKGKGPMLAHRALEIGAGEESRTPDLRITNQPRVMAMKVGECAGSMESTTCPTWSDLLMRCNSPQIAAVVPRLCHGHHYWINLAAVFCVEGRAGTSGPTRRSASASRLHFSAFFGSMSASVILDATFLSCSRRFDELMA